MRRVLFVMVGIMLASLAVSAEDTLNPKATTPFSGDTTGGPTWFRAGTLGTGASGSCLIATSAQVSYETIEFYVDTTGLYTIYSAWTGFDGFLNLYETAFDPLDQCLNLIALNDSAGSIANSEIVDVALTAGVQYVLIATGISPSDEGPYAGTFNGVGTAILGVVPDLSTVLFDQPSTGGSDFVVSTFDLSSGVGTYSADDFVLTGTPGDTIELIHVEGWSNNSTLDPDASWIGFRIYPDSGGVPGGQPEDGGGTEIWSHVASIGDAGLDVTDNNITLDLIAAGLGGVFLPAGTYWLTVYPALDAHLGSTYYWFWDAGVGQGHEAHIIDNGNYGGFPWTPMSGAGVSFSNLAFRLEGTTDVSPVVEDPYCHISGAFVVPPGLTEPLGDMMFSNDGSVVYFVDRSEYDDSAVWSAPVIRDDGGNVTGFGSMTPLFADEYIDTGLEFAPGSTTMFYRGWGPNEAAIAQRRSDGAIEYTEIYNYEAYFGGLAFIPPGYTRLGNLVSTSYYDEAIYSHAVTDDGDGTYTVADGILYADLSGSGLDDSMGDVEFVTSGHLADSLLIAFHDYVGNSISYIDLDPSTGLPAEGLNPTVHPFLAGTTEAWGIAIDPVTGYVWATMYEPTGVPHIIAIAVPTFADGFESGDTSAWMQ